jgi:hypothetical protein
MKMGSRQGAQWESQIPSLHAWRFALCTVPARAGAAGEETRPGRMSIAADGSS